MSRGKILDSPSVNLMTRLDTSIEASILANTVRMILDSREKAAQEGRQEGVKAGRKFLTFQWEFPHDYVLPSLANP